MSTMAILFSNLNFYIHEWRIIDETFESEIEISFRSTLDIFPSK